MEKRNAPPKKEGKLLTVADAARILGLSEVRVRQLCKDGRIGEKVGQHYVIREDEAHAFKRIERRPGRPRRKN